MFMLLQAMCDLHSLGYDILDAGPSDIRVSVDGGLRLQLQLQLHSSFKASGVYPRPVKICCCLLCCACCKRLSCFPYQFASCRQM